MHKGKSELVCAMLIYAVLMLGVKGARAQSMKHIHVLHGIVTAVRQVKANANVLGASTDMWGNIQCFGCSGASSRTLTIKRSSIFRVETASHYYDLSKICGMRGGFRWPRVYTLRPIIPLVNVDTWDHWEQLRVGDRVAMLFETTIVRLPTQRCQQLGMISKSEVGKTILSFWDPKAMKIYKSHCVYKVSIMHVRVRLASTKVDDTRHPDINTETWDFMVVGSGPKDSVTTHPIGLHYPDHRPPF